MVNKIYITIPQLAKMLGVSRISVYKKVRKGQIPAIKVGRTYIIKDSDIVTILHHQLTSSDKSQIDKVVKKTVREYGQALKKLSRE